MDEQKIKEAAYALWEQDGKPDGQDLEHWFRATTTLGNTDSSKASLSPGIDSDAQASNTFDEAHGDTAVLAKKTRTRKG